MTDSESRDLLRLTRTMSLKFRPAAEKHAELDKLFDDFGRAVTFTVAHVRTVYESFKKLEVPFKDERCQSCNTDNVVLRYELNGVKYCGKCFLYSWSTYRLLAADGFFKTLRETF